MGTAFTLGATLAPDFETFYAMRALMGITLTACQAVGLSYVKEMFFYHEHARKIGIWAALLLMSPFCGPLFGNFIIARTGEWRNVFWFVFGVCCLDLILIILFSDETWYRRDIPTELQPPRGNRLLRLIGVWQLKHHRGYFLTVQSSVHRLVAVCFKPIIIPTMFFIGFSFMWAVGINVTSSILLETPREQGGYGFSPLNMGYIYFTPIVSVILGELFGHFGNDWVAAQYVKRNHGIMKPEARLPISYIALFLMIPGLVLLGQALKQLLHYSAIIMGWGMYMAGAMVTTVTTTAYLLDSYPNGAGEVAGCACDIPSHNYQFTWAPNPDWTAL
jgi:MFS family permease